MKERAKEIRAPKKRMTKAEKAQQARKEVEEKIASFEGNDKVLPRSCTGSLPPRPQSWSRKPGMACRRTPWTAKSSCFMQDAKKFGTRYLTFGFNDVALSWTRARSGPRHSPLPRLDEQLEDMLSALVAKAVGR